jgi:hypothetical protein
MYDSCTGAAGISTKGSKEISPVWVLGPEQRWLQLPTSVQEQLRESFNRFDMDGDGMLSAGELRVALSGMGSNVSQDEVRLRVVDTQPIPLMVSLYIS